MVKASFLKIFAKSPIKPMQRHVGIVYQCVATLVPFFEKVLAGDWKLAKTEHEKISSLEGKADQLKKEIRLHLPNRLLLPIDRADFVGLLKSQDHIANTAKKLSSLVYTRKMHFPEQIAAGLMNFVHLGVNATKLTKNIINEIDQLIETGFSGAEAQLVESIIVELEDTEKNSDVIQHELRQKLFQIENDLPPIHAIFLYRAIDSIAELADKAQQVGHRLEPLLTTK
jgi:predicted phosphate transport protein (TIGR00153 family)